MHNFKMAAVLLLSLTSLRGVCNQGTAATPASKTALSSNLSPSTVSVAGDYYWHDAFSGTNLHLFRDGSYKQQNHVDCSDDTGAFSRYLYGTYSFKNGVVMLSPQYAMPGPGAKPKYANKRRKWTGPRTRLVPVAWGARLYLLAQNEQEIDFCNAVNLGLEPRSSTFSRRVLSAVKKLVIRSSRDPRHPNIIPSYAEGFLMREGNEKQSVTGSPQLSSQWKGYLLPTPVKGKLLSLGKNSTAIINVGQADGIKLGTAFTDSKDERGNNYIVVALQNHQATINNVDTPWVMIHVGDAVSTRSSPHPSK